MAKHWLLPWQPLPLRQQMLLVFSAVMLVFTLMLGLFVNQQIDNAALKGKGEQTAQDAAFFANLLEADIESHLTHISVRAENLHNAGWHQNLRAFQITLNRLQEAQPHYAWMGFANELGTVQAATQNMLVGADVAQRPWFRQALQGPVVVDVHEAQALSGLLPQADPSQHHRLVDVAAPVRDDQDRLIGVLGVHLSEEWLSRRINGLASQRFNNARVRPAVIGPDGAFRLGDPRSVEGLETQALWASAQQLKQGWVRLTPTNGEPTVVGFARHQGPSAQSNLQWVSVVPLPVSSIMAELRTTRALALGGVALVSLMAWGTLYLLLKLLERPLRQLMRQVRAAQDTHETLPAVNGLPREFVDIQQTVNNFLASLRAREADLQSALDELRDSFTGVSETFPGVLFRLEAKPDGLAEFSYLSPSATHYLHVDAKAMPLPVLPFFSREDVSTSTDVTEVLMRQLAAAQPFDFSFTISGLDGVRRHMRIKGHLRGKGRGRRVWQGAIFDVSDLVQAQMAAAEADQAKSRFLATMSHELRTPLNGILGFAQLLQQEVQTDSQRSDVRKIIDTTEVLTCILNDILDFSKIEEGKLQLETRTFSIEQLVESSASLFHVEAERRQLDFLVQVNAPAQLQILGDPTRIKQVMNNLLSNAMKFTEQWQVRLAVACALAPEPEACLHLQISDTGMGMSPQSLGKLFQRFEQSDNTIFRRFGGSGLGLAIVKGLVDAMGGRIAVESQPGQGTVFTVDIPLRQVPTAAPTVSASTGPSLAPLHVLVVDDVAMNRELISRMLQAGAHTVDEAVDGQQAVAMSAAIGYDLILMDIDMPVMDGLEASRHIRQRPGPSQQTPIIALSGHAFESDIRNAREAGIDDHLAKPVVFARLKEKMRSVLLTHTSTVTQMKLPTDPPTPGTPDTEGSP